MRVTDERDLSLFQLTFFATSCAAAFGDTPDRAAAPPADRTDG